MFRLFTMKLVSLFINAPPKLLLTNHCVYSIITDGYKVNRLFIIKRHDANTTNFPCFKVNKHGVFVDRKERIWKTKECV